MLCLAAALALLLTGCVIQPAPGETTADITTVETQTQPPTTEPEPTQEEWAVLTPPLEYEIINGFAKTPTHYYAAHDGGILRTPIGDISKQEKIPLPDSHEGMKLNGAEICGITEEWLFVNIWEAREKKRDTYGDGPDDYYEYEDYTDRTCVTYRIAMGSWKAEAIAAGIYDYRPLPWYNSASDSLIIPQVVKDDEENWSQLLFEAMPLSTRKRVPVPLDNERLAIRFWSSWWQNTLDGNAVLVDCQTSEYNNYYVFDKNNQVQLNQLGGMHFATRYEVEPLRKNKAEEDLYAIYGCGPYITCGAYVYYVQYNPDWDRRDFYRVNTDGTGRKLLREDTNIFQLHSLGGKLFCQAYHPTEVDKWDARQIDMYLLDKEGKVKEVLFHYYEDTEGNSGYGLASYGDKLMVTYGVIYGQPSFFFLYDPATGARFPAQKG